MRIALALLVFVFSGKVFSCTLLDTGLVQVGSVEQGTVISKFRGAVGHFEGNHVYNTKDELVGTFFKRAVLNLDGRTIGFIAGSRMINSQNKVVAYSEGCIIPELAAAYLLMANH